MTTTSPLALPGQVTTALVVTSDALLLDELTRLAAAAGAAPDHVADAGAALPVWGRPPLVLVGSDLLPQLALSGPPRRSGVYVVTWGEPAEEVYRPALAVGAEGVIGLPAGAELLAELLTDLGDDGAAAAVTVGVQAGSGGAGATVFAAAMAQLAAQSGATAVIDADPLGAGMDSVLGMEEQSGVRWGELAATAGRLGGRALRDALPHRGELGLLTWGRFEDRAVVEPPVAREVLSAARRGHRTVILDLPRTSDRAGEELALRCDVLLVVVRATVTGVAAAARLLRHHRHRADVRVVLRGSADPEAIEQALGVEVLTAMPDQRRLAESIDLGFGPVRSRRGPLGRAARDVLGWCRVHGGAA